MQIYSRWSPDDPRALVETAEHVRAHLASTADPDDDPHRYAHEVTVSQEPQEQDGVPGFLITGTLDRDPVAPYLSPEYDPDADTEFDTSGFRREDFEEVAEA